MIDIALEKEQLRSEIAHWRTAVEALQDLDALASPAAWAGLEEYLRTGLRDRLQSVVSGVVLEAAALEGNFKSGAEVGIVRGRLLRLRARYLQLEVTESVIMYLTDGVTDSLKRLKEMGLELAIDDLLALADTFDMKVHVENEGVCNIAGFARLEALVTAYRPPRLRALPDIANAYRTNMPPSADDLARLLPFTARFRPC